MSPFPSKSPAAHPPAHVVVVGEEQEVGKSKGFIEIGVAKPRAKSVFDPHLTVNWFKDTVPIQVVERIVFCTSVSVGQQIDVNNMDNSIGIEIAAREGPS